MPSAVVSVDNSSTSSLVSPAFAALEKPTVKDAQALIGSLFKSAKDRKAELALAHPDKKVSEIRKLYNSEAAMRSAALMANTQFLVQMGLATVEHVKNGRSKTGDPSGFVQKFVYTKPEKPSKAETSALNKVKAKDAELKAKDSRIAELEAQLAALVSA